ncbi:hypothetical protein DLM45_03500 [Hyphomicrobium methylovorum]|nr:hypothetical protein [Hyphomicrobium methylovorum]
MSAFATAVTLTTAAVVASLVFISTLSRVRADGGSHSHSPGDGRAELFQSYSDDGMEHERPARTSLSDESLAQQRIMEDE